MWLYVCLRTFMGTHVQRLMEARVHQILQNQSFRQLIATFTVAVNATVVLSEVVRALNISVVSPAPQKPFAEVVVNS